MNTINQTFSKVTLSPQKVQEKADILENNLFKSISKQTDPAKMHIKINRANFPDPVINKGLLQLMPKFNIKPREYLHGLRDLMQKDIPESKQESFKTDLDLNDTEEIYFDDSNIVSRNFEAIASKKELEIIVRGIPAIKSINGEISKSFFDHKLSPGELLKGGAINFKEINKYPIINADKKLFYITHEKQGKQGVSFDGKIIPVEEAKPFAIHIGPGVEKREDSTNDSDEAGKSKGYFLHSQSTGVIILNRNEKGVINGIGISDKVEVKKLDYSTGNIGTQFTCPIHMKIGEICNDFKIRVNGKVEVAVIDGGEIITNNEAVIVNAQSGSAVMALKDIIIDYATHSKIISEHGTITINKGLIDCETSSKKVVFERGKGLITNNQIETENLSLSGLYFSGKNSIYFGNNLFVEKEELLTSRENLRAEKLKLSNTQEELTQKLHAELKRMATQTLAGQDLIKHMKPIIIATKTMDYEIIYKEMDAIQKRNNTKVVSNVRKLFETLEKIPQSIRSCNDSESTFNEKLNAVNQRMASMELTIEGFLRRAATLEIFCGISSDKNSKEGKKGLKPNLILESDDTEKKIIKVTGSYSSQNGFEFVQ